MTKGRCSERCGNYIIGFHRDKAELIHKSSPQHPDSIRTIYLVLFQTQETSAKTTSGRGHRGHLDNTVDSMISKLSASTLSYYDKVDALNLSSLQSVCVYCQE